MQVQGIQDYSDIHIRTKEQLIMGDVFTLFEETEATAMNHGEKRMCNMKTENACNIIILMTTYKLSSILRDVVRKETLTLVSFSLPQLLHSLRWVSTTHHSYIISHTLRYLYNIT